eukprot:scaffold41262_cov31-Tisochrysis_lutea.AAC.4
MLAVRNLISTQPQIRAHHILRTLAQGESKESNRRHIFLSLEQAQGQEVRSRKGLGAHRRPAGQPERSRKSGSATTREKRGLLARKQSWLANQ